MLLQSSKRNLTNFGYFSAIIIQWKKWDCQTGLQLNIYMYKGADTGVVYRKAHSSAIAYSCKSLDTVYLLTHKNPKSDTAVLFVYNKLGPSRSILWQISYIIQTALHGVLLIFVNHCEE